MATLCVSMSRHTRSETTGPITRITLRHGRTRTGLRSDIIRSTLRVARTSLQTARSLPHYKHLDPDGTLPLDGTKDTIGSVPIGRDQLTPVLPVPAPRTLSDRIHQTMRPLPATPATCTSLGKICRGLSFHPVVTIELKQY